MARAHASHVHAPLLLLSLRFEAVGTLKCSANPSSSSAGLFVLLLLFCSKQARGLREPPLTAVCCPVTLLAALWQPSAMMASPMRASSASATFDGQYVQPTREGLTALSITLTYLFNSQGSNGVSCLQGSWTRLAVLFGPHYSRLLVYCIRWTLFVLCKCLYTHNVHRCLVGIAINVANPFLSCSSVTVLDTPVSPPQPMALRLSHAYGLQ